MKRGAYLNTYWFINRNKISKNNELGTSLLYSGSSLY